MRDFIEKALLDEKIKLLREVERNLEDQLDEEAFKTVALVIFDMINDLERECFE